MEDVGAKSFDGLSRQPLGWNHGVDLNLASGFWNLDLTDCYNPGAPPEQMSAFRQERLVGSTRGFVEQPPPPAGIFGKPRNHIPEVVRDLRNRRRGDHAR
jgi:hypothetical protein